VFTGTQAGPVACQQVFAEEFKKMNIGLFMPKKDQCDKCCAHTTGNVSETDSMDDVTRKEDARVTTEGDKSFQWMSRESSSAIPTASALYFRQKLAVHNFTL